MCMALLIFVGNDPIFEKILVTFLESKSFRHSPEYKQLASCKE